MPSADWRPLVAERFPPREESAERADWEAMKRRLIVDQTVSGTVVAKAPFGAWVDIGVGFPALLEITVIEGLTPEKYRADDWYPIGSEMSAFVAGFVDSRRQIYLWQVRRGEEQS